MTLADITVVDLTLQLPGPYTTMLLRSLGARVIKIEPPGGDVARELDPAMFDTLNAGKEVIELNLREPGAVEVLERLARQGDVFLEGFRPGVADRLGAGYERISQVRPDVVYCSISGYGQTGPYRALAGHDLNYMGVAGGAPTGPAAHGQTIGVPIVDLAAGTAAALSVVSALRRRDRTGDGSFLDVAMLDSAVTWANMKWEPAGVGGEPAYGVFAAGDGRLLTLAVLEDKFWRALCEALGWEDWIDTPSLSSHHGRKQRADEIVERLSKTLIERDRDEWLALFGAADVPAAPVSQAEEVVSHPQVIERRLWSSGRARLRAPLPLEIAAPPPTDAPERSQHAAPILGELGYHGEVRDRLFESGAVLAPLDLPGSDDELLNVAESDAHVSNPEVTG